MIVLTKVNSYICAYAFSGENIKTDYRCLAVSVLVFPSTCIRTEMEEYIAYHIQKTYLEQIN